MQANIESVYHESLQDNGIYFSLANGNYCQVRDYSRQENKNLEWKYARI